jgi:juvenile-hormone esterase
LLPVIIYIHGGGFFAGTAGPSITGADYFMDTEDVVFVTMNYRLGPL